MLSSICGTDGSNNGLAAYSATKGAIDGMTLPMAREVGPDGIRVMTVAPGCTWSPMQHNLRKNYPVVIEMHDTIMEQQIPLGRFGEVEEFAHLSEHIVENAYLNGTVMRLDGGMRFSSFKKDMVTRMYKDLGM